MPYILLAIGLLIGLYALYRFFIQANIKEIKAFALTSAFVLIAGALLFMAITGRLAAALGLLGALAPIALGLWRTFKNAGSSPPDPAKHDGPMSRALALEILGLDDNASEDDIKAAYKKLMQKVHPDHEGSDWMAAKLNEAKAFLLERDG